MTSGGKLAELDALYEAATPGTWYPKPNDLIGGWCVMNVDKPPSEVDNKTEFDVADFIPEPAARHIAALHNNYPALGAVVSAARLALDELDTLIHANVGANYTVIINATTVGRRDDLWEALAALEGETK